MKCPDKKDGKNHFIGHRRRLRDKFLSHPDSMRNYELIEMLLFHVFLVKDTKKLAKTLCDRFGTFRRIIFADMAEINKIDGLGITSICLLHLLREIFSRMLLEQISDSPIMASSAQVIDYYKNIIGIIKKEQLRLMFLNNKNRLISEDILQVGTINHASIYPREIMQKALEYGASAIIMIHNHPSGDPKPSRQDVVVSRNLKDIAKKLDIELLDHLIIGKNSVSSLKEMALI
ncbi:MAG: DNA repair protein RadC [Holosporaceae bacterium]|jgi:DNA repair protein RadC|nr:DNA repair protein RadC [Holosporaceae bacterium]